MEETYFLHTWLFLNQLLKTSLSHVSECDNDLKLLCDKKKYKKSNKKVYGNR